MKLFKSFFFSLATSATLYASLTSTPYIHNDLRVLEELDIKTTYITDYKLQKEIQKRLLHTKNNYTQKLNKADLFIPQIKKILKENQMPSAFLYLVMAESNFIANASSNKKAKGLWQFMPGTANYFGLELNEYIDERMDLVKSTQAAVVYLKKLNEMFDKWYLAAVAYNCGEGRVIEGLTRSMIDMHCETVGYNVCRKDPKINKYRQTIREYQKKRIKFSKLGKVYKDVKTWGYEPDIDRILTFQKNLSRQYLPKESREYIRKIIVLALMNNSDFLLEDEHVHLVNRGLGDPISSINIKGGLKLKNIATLLGMKKEELQNLNQHVKKGFLPSSQKEYTLYIPYSKLSRFNANKHNLDHKEYEYYRVKAGDSLYSIGKKFEIDFKNIRSYNNLRSNILQIGQELIVPLNPDVYKKPIDYVIQVGDTLSKISRSYKVSIKQLMSDNKLNDSIIKVGDRLVINIK